MSNRKGIHLMPDGRLRAYIWCGDKLRRKIVESIQHAHNWLDHIEALNLAGSLKGRGQFSL